MAYRAQKVQKVMVQPIVSFPNVTDNLLFVICMRIVLKYIYIYIKQCNTIIMSLNVYYCQLESDFSLPTKCELNDRKLFLM